MISASTDSIKEAGNYLNIIATIIMKGGDASRNLNDTTTGCNSFCYGKAYYV